MSAVRVGTGSDYTIYGKEHTKIWMSTEQFFGEKAFFHLGMLGEEKLNKIQNHTIFWGVPAGPHTLAPPVPLY